MFPAMSIQAHAMIAAKTLPSRLSSADLQPGPHGSLVRSPNGLQCPQCRGDRIHGHGSFPLKDGTRQPRYRCLACDKTFNHHTGTPLAYLKKRDRWERLAGCMVQELSVRQTAAALDVQVATAFRWRHRLLSALGRRPQPSLTGTVAAGEAFVRYSEKGSRHTSGPGARGSRCGHGRRPFRRFIDGKPSCVLLACAGEQQAGVIVSRGRPRPEDLVGRLKDLLEAGVELCASGRAPYAEACRRLGIAHWEASGQGSAVGFAHLSRSLNRLRMGLYGWLKRFHGVATRYVSNYLTWHLFTERTFRLPAATAGQQLLADACSVLHQAGGGRLMSPGRAA